VSAKELVTFTRQFATMIRRRLALVQCLDILAGQQENKVFKNVLKDIKSSVEQGATSRTRFDVTQGLRRAVHEPCARRRSRRHPRHHPHRLAIYIEKNVKLVRQVRGAMTYPIIVIFIMIGVMTVLLTFVIPAFEGMFKDFGAKDALPKLTQMVIWVSHAFITWLPLIIPVVVASIFAFTWIYRRPKGKRAVHRILLTMPIVGNVLRKIAVARFTRTMGTLLQSGVPILDALEVVAKSAGNVIIEEGLMYARAKISEGKNLADPLMESKVFPTMVVQMISVGEPKPARSIRCSTRSPTSTKKKRRRRLSAHLHDEPLLMVVVGAMVGVVLMAMYLPIFSLAGAMKSE